MNPVQVLLYKSSAFFFLGLWGGGGGGDFAPSENGFAPAENYCGSHGDISLKIFINFM